MSRDPKIDRKALKKNDNFVRKGREAMEALFRERKIAVVALGGLAALLAVYYAYDWYTNRQLNRDWVAYYKAEEAKGDEQTEKLKQAYQLGGNTRAAFIAAVALGDHYSEAARRKAEASRVKAAVGDAKPASKKPVDEEAKKDLEPTLTAEKAAENASEWYGKALNFAGLLAGEKELITLDIGHSAEAQGKWDDAAAKYKAVMEMKGESKPLAMLHLGRIHELKQDKEGAKTLYRTLSQEFAGTEYATTAKTYLRRMDSALLASPTGKQ